MRFSLTPKRKERRVLDLQLTAMIDIFSLIVIFLIKGTVFGVSDLSVDPTLKLPESRSKESLDTAPTAQIVGDRVVFSGSQSPALAQGVPIAEITGGGPGKAGLQSEIQNYLGKIPAEVSGSGTLLSLIADRGTRYSQVFQVVQFFRESGFDSVLFVAAVKEGSQ